MNPKNILLTADQHIEIEAQADELIGNAPRMIDRWLLGEMTPVEEVDFYIAFAAGNLEGMRKPMRAAAVRVLTLEAQKGEMIARRDSEADMDEERMLHAEEARQISALTRGLERMTA